MRGSQAASAETVMSDETDGIAVMDERIITGDFLVDRDKDLFFANQLQQVAQLYALTLNQLPHGHGRRHFTGEITFAVGRLELSHQGNRHHPLSRPFLNCR